jgi:hypothetical protein
LYVSGDSGGGFIYLLFIYFFLGLLNIIRPSPYQELLLSRKYINDLRVKRKDLKLVVSQAISVFFFFFFVLCFLINIFFRKKISMFKLQSLKLRSKKQLKSKKPKKKNWMLKKIF